MCVCVCVFFLLRAILWNFAQFIYVVTVVDAYFVFFISIFFLLFSVSFVKRCYVFFPFFIVICLMGHQKLHGDFFFLNFRHKTCYQKIININLFRINAEREKELNESTHDENYWNHIEKLIICVFSWIVFMWVSEFMWTRAISLLQFVWWFYCEWWWCLCANQ